MQKSTAAAEWEALRGAILFLTRFPVTTVTSMRDDGIHASASPPLGTAYFPLVGAAVGATGGVAFVLLSWCGLPVSFCAIAALTVIAIVTGCLHEDGLADFADGIGGGLTRERRLEIMKDSRLGVFGVLTLVATVGLRWSAIAAIGASGSEVTVLGALIAAHAFSRLPLPLVLAYARPATTTGLSADVDRPNRMEIWIAFVTACVTALAAAPTVPVVVGVALTGCVTWLIMVVARHYLGGHTGDVLGAIQQGGEIVMLAAIAAAT